MFSTRSATSIMVCPAQQRREALLQLAAVHHPAQQAALQQALVKASTRPEGWSGLWVACQAGRVCAAAWVELQENRIAQLWLPKQNNQFVEPLLSQLHRWVATQGLVLCHVALDETMASWEAPLLNLGMQRLATLDHLAWHCRPVSHVRGLPPLRPFDELTPAQQQALVEQVGDGSLDCPALRDVLPAQALLEGFYHQASSASEHWYYLQGEQDRHAGLLLLDASPGREHWSVQLMGLVPGWRGQGQGKALVQQAQAMVAQAGASQLALTVDRDNLPAQRAYRQAGMLPAGEHQLLGWCVLPATELNCRA